MSPLDRKEEDVRRMLDAGQPPAVPPDLAERAMERGRRLLRRRRAVRTALWLLLFAVVTAVAAWAAVGAPWTSHPAETTPRWQTGAAAW